MFKIGFVLNSRTAKKKKFYKALDQAKKSIRNIEFTVVETMRPGHAALLAEAFVNEGFTHIIAVGGDGTLNEVLNGIMSNFNDQIILGILPQGTANDFVKSINSPKNLTSLFEAVSSEKVKKIDIGLIDYEGGQRYFINIADLGIGASVVQKVNKSKKVFGSNFTFFKAIVQTFLTYKNQDVTCHTEHWDYEGKTNSLVMANGKYFGSGLCISPNSALDDGQFSIVISGDITIGDYLKNVKSIKKGKLINHPLVQYKTASKLEITAPQPCGIEADGEFICNTPAAISLADNKIKFLIS